MYILKLKKLLTGCLQYTVCPNKIKPRQ